MKKMVDTAFVYGILGLVAGVFYREFGRIVGYSGPSVLSVVHTHLLALGMMFSLIVALFYKLYNLEGNKKFKLFFIMYNIALPLMVIMLMTRGITQVLQWDLTRAADFSISGIAGISHILMAGAIIHFFLALREEVAKAK